MSLQVINIFQSNSIIAKEGVFTIKIVSLVIFLRVFVRLIVVNSYKIFALRPEINRFELYWLVLKWWFTLSLLCKSVLFISLSDFTSEIFQVNCIGLLKLVFELYNLRLQLLKNIIFNFPFYFLKARANHFFVVFFLIWKIWGCDTLSKWAFAFSDSVTITKTKNEKSDN